MTKYIDLLRAHQKKNPDSEVSSTNLTPEAQMMNNPYSKNEATLEGDNNLDPDLIEEQDVPIAEAAEPNAEHELLLIEEDDDLAAPAAVQSQPLQVTQNTASTVIDTITPESAVVNEQNTSGLNVSAWLKHLTKTMSVIFLDAQQQKPTDVLVLNGSLRELLQHFESDHRALDALELNIARNLKDICQSEEGVNDLVEKAVMMMLYTIKISIQLKLQQQEIIHHTIAAMLHHIGMAMVPDEIRHQTGKLSKDEIKLIRRAPQNAVTYLQTCQLDNDNILLAASQSSERFDGSGATGLSGHSISWVARVVGLLSMFESLIHFRPYRQRLLPRDAIRELVNKHKQAFDPVMLKALIEAVSLYPVGTFVQLNTGEIGQVIIVHSKFPLRPIVRVNMDKYGNKINEREIDIKQQPNLMIQKCMYEEALVNPDGKSI